MATYNVSTKVDKNSQPVNTKLTIDFEGATDEMLREMATQSIVIKVQGQWRKNGIPASASIKAVDYRPGTRLVQAPSLEQLVTKMTDEEKRKLIELLGFEVKDEE